MNLNYILHQQNPWWQTGFDLSSLPEYNLKRRFLFHDIKEIYEKTKLMIFLKGLRRLGKSTLIKQLLIYLIEEKHINPDTIYFIELSQSFHDLQAFLTKVPKKSVVFIDEIQYEENWRDILKLYYDLNPETKIIFSGSALISFIKEKESLLGRFMSLNLKPLSFKEYLFLKYNSHSSVNVAGEKEFYDYIQFGEFPEVLFIEQEHLKHSYIKNSIIEPLLTSDITFYNIEKKKEFAGLIKTLAADIGQTINKSNISREIGLSRPILDKYIAILQDIGLIELLSNYYPSIREIISSDKKVYFHSINIALHLLGIQSYETFFVKSIKGHVIENVIFKYLDFLYDEIFYWRRKEKEIDFIINHNGILEAIEVKDKHSFHAAEREKYHKYATLLNIKECTIIYQGNLFEVLLKE